MDPEYHPAFGHRPRHDHHRRARRLLIGGMATALCAIVLLYWSTQDFWGDRQVDVGRIVGFVGLGAGGLLLIAGSVAWFSIDDDEHPDDP